MDKIQEVNRELTRLGINPDDLIEKFILGSGSGGQKVNKTHSCVYLKDPTSQIEVKCQQERSRELNRYYARKMLIEKIKEIRSDEKSKKQQAIEKIRRQKKRRTRKQKEKMLEEKRHHSTIKKLRKPPTDSQ